MKPTVMQQAKRLAERNETTVYIGTEAKSATADQYVITFRRQARSLYEVQPDGSSRWIGSPATPISQ